MAYTNSPLVTYTNLSPNHSGTRNHAIDTITIHCVVGQWTAKVGCDYFAKTTRQASCNYIVGKDGSIGLCVEEKNRSWCSSSSSNDNRAITIEVASDTTHPYAVTDAALNALIKLCADICKRNGIKELKWKGDKSLIGQIDKQNMTVHRWFANKACPGDYLYNRHGYIAQEVNKILNASSAPAVPSTGSASTKPVTQSKFPAVPFLAYVNVPDLNYRSKPSMEGTVKGQTGKGTFTIVEVIGEWGKLKSGVGYIYLGNPEYVSIGKTVATAKPAAPVFKPYLVKITTSALNIRKGPSTLYKINRCLRDEGGVYTIVAQEGNWGKLKSGEGWICLDYTKKI